MDEDALSAFPGGELNTDNMSTPLLPFQSSLISQVVDPATSEIILVARGLGLRTIVCTLLKIYNAANNLVLLMNASQDEESGIGQLLGVMGCRNPGLHIVTFEMARKDRKDLYKGGGIISVTSRILVGDMLQSDIPVELITGIIVLHAEKVTPTSLEAFIVRLYREKNKAGFLKAFSDQPEHITNGLFPLRSIMKELHLRKAHIYPRFHEEVQSSLERRKADVVELHQPMTDFMSDIHHAILLCITATLSELKRSNTTLDLDDLTVENAYFKMFDVIVRRQLDPVWHKVGPKTKQLVSDLGTLRQLLAYLLSYDCIALHMYIESIIHANSVTVRGERRQNQSPWVFLEAAEIIFRTAKRRCYLTTSAIEAPLAVPTPTVPIDWDDEDAWAALAELQGTVGSTPVPARQKWLPEGMKPVLEELPKWNLLVSVLEEIEELILSQPLPPLSQATNTVLVMAGSQRTCDQLREFLGTMNKDAPPGQQGRRMMERRLRDYLFWKSRLNDKGKDKQSRRALQRPDDDGGSGISEALRRKDAAKAFRAQNRRRVRGGAPSSGGSHSYDAVPDEEGTLRGTGEMLSESDGVAAFLASQPIDGSAPPLTVMDGDDSADALDILQMLNAETFSAGIDEDHYGLVTSEEMVLVRAYSDDADDQMLAEVNPRFIVMFEPNQDFIRRIEVYRSSRPGLAVRVYFLLYEKSCEEVKYLTAIRREKDAFERLIKERGSMLLPIGHDHVPDRNDMLLQTISTRLAGGGRPVDLIPPQVIVDSREFGSSLPGLLHAAGVRIIPVTLTVGDYILSPDMCVERKSLPDLVSSLNHGRLYTQCELMSNHYKLPILLIEFEEHKSFTMEIAGEVKSYAKPTGKYPKKLGSGAVQEDGISMTAIQSKLVLLTISFPRLRIIWSSSAYATADIFKDLKQNYPEPDASKAITVGAEDDTDAGSGINTQAEELLRSLPGVTAKNVKHVMSKVKSVRELCGLDLAGVQEILGVEPGKSCWEFLHQGDR